ncbi:MAG TPA: L-2-hydroxyglutarate oxidase [Gemmatimonadaceae bacterium]|nr:L-2-hydroxyglutarate oxidase [Gemmatimonadaceae bacterium]
MRVAIVGGGLVGLATGYKLILAKPDWDVVILEKENAVGQHQSGHNSGVLHAGLYYAPGSAKARLAVSGIRQMTAFAREHGVAHEICGKVVVATTSDELARLDKLYERGTLNGLAGVRRLSVPELRELEPHAAGIAALHVPEEGIIDYPGVCRALVAEIEAHGGRVATRREVTAMTERPDGWRIAAGVDEVRADFIITCAGLYSDRVAALAGERRSIRIVGFRGDYFTLRASARHLVKNLIYPVPNPAFPFLGVHFTRLVRGGVEAGPNAVLAMAREGYRKSDWNVRDAADALGYPGLWRFVGRHARMCVAEVRRSLSPHLFAETLRRLVPELQDSDLEPGGAGVRAQAMTPNGKLVEDFALVRRPKALHVLNAPSPAATASLAIADEIVRAVLTE